MRRPPRPGAPSPPPAAAYFYRVAPLSVSQTVQRFPENRIGYRLRVAASA